ncbi:myelin expression factor 2 [Corythoichthys intestinalis]|uniref:myelin expression factor 2 n=1 Tax=Corythoichthys intestinalis TaxID=161448 RepID=UPI0025A5CF3E|nr:myelin expression factor 2 [Corythoichthys intestinalis]XP_061796366.1 myelin expression factor 2-like [Nerophis lumbriciformis]
MEDIIPGLGEDSKMEEPNASVISDNSEPDPETPNGVKTDAEDSTPPKEKYEGKEKSSGGRKGGRYHPYKDRHGGEKKSFQRNRVYISNIPYDMKWQAIKDLMRDKVGEVTYVELFKDAEGKSRGCGVVDFTDEEFVTKAVETMNQYDLNGRPLNIREDPDGEYARRVLQRIGGQQGGRVQDIGLGGINIPPSIANNPNIPPEIKHALQAGRLGSTVFVVNLDFKVGWKKLKEVFSMAGVVKRADVKEDKDGKSRGMGTVTFEQPLEALQAISMFNGQMLFDRPMHVKMDDKSIPPDNYRQMEKTPQLPRGLSGIGMGLGPGGQPINANNLNSGGGMSSSGPAGMDVPGYGGMNRLGGGMGVGSGFGNMDNMASMMNLGARELMSRMGDMYRSRTGGMDRDFGSSDMQMNRGFGDSFGGLGGSFGGGMGLGGMGSMGTGLGGGMGSMAMDRMGSGFDRMGMSGMDLNRSFGGGGPSHLSMSDRGYGPKAGCQIFVRNLSYDLKWQKLKEKFSHCGQVMFAEIKMTNGKSKGCGTVRFDSQESAEKACRMMNGTKINGREVDVRIDRYA